jgi:hypothetical protein|tara:strand:+ start:900 stop:1784 length:885 start_codon:yes stop_codon:yes gene_type:complete
MSKEKLQDDYKNPVSATDMVELAKQQYEQKKVSDYKFPTEIVDLPSKGLVYSKDNALSSGKVEMKYMTAKEEDILTTQSYIKDGSVLDRLFQSLIISNGDGTPVKYIDITLGDKNAIMIAARILGYGKDYEVEIDDPTQPGTMQKEVIDLTQFESTEYDGSGQTELHKNEYEFELPQSKRKVTFQALTESKERKIKHQLEAQRKASRKLNDKTDKQLTIRLKNTIVSVDGDTEQTTINHFVENELFAADSRALRTHINKVVPDVDLTYEFISDETGEGRDMLLPMGLGFFWPQS